MKPENWVDLKRYPITQLDSPAGVKLVERCRADIARTAGAHLPAFLLPDALEKFADEARKVAPLARRRDMSRSAYGWMNNSGFAKEHPRAWPQHDRKGTVHYDLYPPDALIRRLYEWPALTKFIGTVLGEERFFICDDPVMSAVLSVMKTGDEQGWHFDTNDYSVTLCLQSCEDGGEFQCAPYVRSDENENYETVAALFRGEKFPNVNVAPTAGTLTMFRGRRSLHRVNKVGGTSDRLMAIFSYHQEQGFRWPEEMIRMSKNSGATMAQTTM
jgi:hypothetical protein